MSGCNSFTSKGFISQTKSTDPLFKIKKQFVEIKKTFEIRKLSNPVYCWLSFIHVCQYLTENFDYSSNFIVSVYNLFFPLSTFSCHSKSLSGSCNWFLQIFRFKCSPKKHSRLESEKIPKRLPNVWQFFFLFVGLGVVDFYIPSLIGRTEIEIFSKIMFWLHFFYTQTFFCIPANHKKIHHPYVNIRN